MTRRMNKNVADSSRATLTVGEVAMVCEVASKTVTKWIDNGTLKGHRVPGGKERRVLRTSLIQFMKDHGLYLGALAGAGPDRILVIGADSEFVRRFSMPGTNYVCVFAYSGFEAGINVNREYYDAIVIDLAMGRSECLVIVDYVMREFTKALVVVLAGEDEVDPDVLATSGSRMTFKKPFDVALVAKAIMHHIDSVKEA